MKKRLAPIIAILALLLNGCHKENVEPSLENRIIGNWLVVREGYDPTIVEWAFFYVGSVKLYKDKSFKLNVGELTDDPNTPTQGTWRLISNKNSIVFYSYVNDVGTVYTDTTEFEISFDDSEKLVLENDQIRVLHKKLTN
jgi:hypothetical protein